MVRRSVLNAYYYCSLCAISSFCIHTSCVFGFLIRHFLLQVGLFKCCACTHKRNNKTHYDNNNSLNSQTKRKKKENQKNQKQKTTLHQNDLVWTFNVIPSENFSTSSSCGISKIVALQEITVVVCYVTFFFLSSFARTVEMGFWFVTFLTQFNKGTKIKLCLATLDTGWRFSCNKCIIEHHWIDALNCKLNKHPNDIVSGEKCTVVSLLIIHLQWCTW